MTQQVFGLPMSCPFCGGDLTIVTTGRPSSWATCAVLDCADCDAELVMRSTLHSAPRRSNNGGGRIALPREHGSQRGYDQHRKLGDLPACTACTDAHNAKTADQKRRQRGVRVTG